MKFKYICQILLEFSQNFTNFLNIFSKLLIIALNVFKNSSFGLKSS